MKPTLQRRPQIAEIPLAGDHRGHAGEACRGDGHDVAVKVEGVDQADTVSAEEASELQDRYRKARRFEGAAAAAPRAHIGGVELRPLWSLGSDTTDMEIPPRSIQPARDLHELPLRSPEVQVGTKQENRRAPGGADAGSSGRTGIRHPPPRLARKDHRCLRLRHACASRLSLCANRRRTRTGAITIRFPSNTVTEPSPVRV